MFFPNTWKKRIGTWKLTIESAFLHLEDGGADTFTEADWFARTLTPHPHSPGLTLTPSYTGWVFVYYFTHSAFVEYLLSARCFEFHTQSRPPMQERAPRAPGSGAFLFQSTVMGAFLSRYFLKAVLADRHSGGGRKLEAPLMCPAVFSW